MVPMTHDEYSRFVTDRPHTMKFATVRADGRPWRLLVRIRPTKVVAEKALAD